MSRHEATSTQMKVVHVHSSSASERDKYFLAPMRGPSTYECHLKQLLSVLMLQTRVSN